MVTRVTRGCAGVAVNSIVAEPVPPDETVFCRVAWAFGPADAISRLRALVPPISAMLSIPALAVPPLLQNETRSLWTAPINGEKCASKGKGSLQQDEQESENDGQFIGHK